MKAKFIILFLLLILKIEAQYDFSVARDTSNYPQIRAELLTISKEIKKDSLNCFLYVKRNLLYFRVINLKACKQDLTKAISLCPKDSLTYIYYYQRGSINDKLGADQEAYDDFSKSIELKPSFAGGYMDRGSFLTSREKFSRGREDLEKALKLKPNWGDVFFNLGLNYELSGDKEKAVLEYKKCIANYKAKDQFLFKAYNNIGNIYSQQLKYSDAIIMFTKAIEAQDNYALAYLNRAEAKYYSGDKVGACQDMKKGIDLGRQDLLSQYNSFCK